MYEIKHQHDVIVWNTNKICSKLFW